MKPRQIARELALLGLSQLPSDPQKLSAKSLEEIVLAAIRTLTGEAEDALEDASAQLKRGDERLLASETLAQDVSSSKTMVADAIDLTQTAINQVGAALKLPEFVYLSNRKEVRSYALEVLTQTSANRPEIDATLEGAMENWQLSRVPRLDRDILRIATAEMVYVGVESWAAINEAVELAKRYGSEDSYKFINAILGRISRQRRQQV